MSFSHSLQVTGIIEGEVYDVEDAKREFDDWSSLSKEAKYRRLQDGSLDPVEEIEEHNTTCVGLHEYIVDELDVGQSVDEDASHLALGDGGGTGTPSTSDTSLFNEVYREQVTDSIDNGNELTTSTFIDSTEANGFDLDELGLYTSVDTGSNILLNHSTFGSVSKDNSKTITFDVSLQFQSA